MTLFIKLNEKNKKKNDQNIGRFRLYDNKNYFLLNE